MALVMIAGMALDAEDVGSVAPCIDPKHVGCVVVSLKETRTEGYNSARSQTWHFGSTTVEEIVARLNGAGD